jgi:hypothetical protein
VRAIFRGIASNVFAGRKVFEQNSQRKISSNRRGYDPGKAEGHGSKQPGQGRAPQTATQDVRDRLSNQYRLPRPQKEEVAIRHQQRAQVFEKSEE